MERMGTGYLGSAKLETSTANLDIIPAKPAKWTLGYNCYKFSFMNPDKACTVKINGGNPIFIDAGVGFNMDQYDAPIRSFVIIEPDIKYWYIATY